jgi:hypothetical protein
MRLAVDGAIGSTLPVSDEDIQNQPGPFAPLRPQPFRPAFLVITLPVLLLSCWAERVGKARLDEVR